MKKPLISDEFDWYDEYFGRDYKLEQQMHHIRQNFESTDKWLYLGADSLDSSFAKIGITMGDLRSRSYSSARPSYFLFCAFKFDIFITPQKMKKVEDEILSKFDQIFVDDEERSKRMVHFESGKISECYSNINFFDFYKVLHAEIYNEHRNSFVISGYEDELGNDEGEFVECIFNSRLPNPHRSYIDMILQQS